MIIQGDRAVVTAEELERRTGWSAKPQGLCKGPACVPAPGADRGDGTLDVAVVAERLRAPLEHDEAHGVWALGPSSGGRALLTAEAPELELPALDGTPFRLSSLLGRKVLLVAWASW